MLRMVVVSAGVALMATACAARGPVLQATAKAQPQASDVRPTQPQSSSPDSLEAFMGKVRAMSVYLRPKLDQVTTVEASDPALMAARLLLEARPTAPRHRVVAREYLRLGILDMAHEHFSKATTLDPRDAAAWDGMARIWRDWGLPHLALPDAYRAVYYAPGSAIAHNTLGTILQALGRVDEARVHYETALAFDVTAAYALTNLCYSWVLDRDAARAEAACGRALQLQPTLGAARNNLALAYAVTGDMPAALDVFAGADEDGRAEYNAGVLYLARRQYRQALAAFESAQAQRPRFEAAETMARLARRYLEQENRP